MTVTLDRTTWTRVRLGDVVHQSKEKVDPADGTVDRYVAGEHMDTDGLRITRWGEVGDGYLGPAFHRRFHPGQILYGSRRTYLRKVAVAGFEGVCSNTTFVLEPKDEDVLSPDFLPFVMSAERFHEFAITASRGSVNPYVNWSDIARYEFDLPPLDEQHRIADLLWAVEAEIAAASTFVRELDALGRAWSGSVLQKMDNYPRTRLAELIDPARPLCYGVVQPGDLSESEDAVPLLRVCDLESGSPCLSLLKRISPDIDRQYRRSRLEAGDVVISIVGTVGRVWVVDEGFVGVNIARAIARLSPDFSKVRAEYLSLILGSPTYQQVLESAAFESARKTLNLSSLAEVEIPVPPLEEQHLLVSQRRIIEEKIEQIEARSEAAVSLSRSLKEKLFVSVI